MTVRFAVEDAKAVGGGAEGLALERAADEVEEGERQVGQVGEGLVLDHGERTSK